MWLSWKSVDTKRKNKAMHLVALSASVWILTLYFMIQSNPLQTSVRCRVARYLHLIYFFPTHRRFTNSTVVFFFWSSCNRYCEVFQRSRSAFDPIKAEGSWVVIFNSNTSTAAQHHKRRHHIWYGEISDWKNQWPGLLARLDDWWKQGGDADLRYSHRSQKEISKNIRISHLPEEITGIRNADWDPVLGANDNTYRCHFLHFNLNWKELRFWV